MLLCSDDVLKFLIGLSVEEIDRLATYNAERHRAHDDIYNRDMARLQERYDRHVADLAPLRAP
jgi:hypothetical protein